jgi:hypothetical protein
MREIGGLLAYSDLRLHLNHLKERIAFSGMLHWTD